MGLGNSTQERKTYVRVSKDKFVVKSDENNPEAVSRVNNNNVTVWELNYSSIEGVLESVVIDNSGYKNSEQCTLVLSDGDDKYNVQLSVDDSFLSAIARRVHGIDLGCNLFLGAFTSFNEEKQKDQVIKYLKVNGEKVAPSESYNAPSWNKVRINGSDVWDKEASNIYIKDIISTKFSSKKQTPASGETTDGKDDLPF